MCKGNGDLNINRISIRTLRSAIGGVVGGTIGYISVSKVVDRATKGVQNVRERVKEFGNKLII